MTDPAPRRAVVRWRTLALVAAVAAVLAGCELATGTVRTATELQEAGIGDPDLQYEDGVASLEYDADPNPLQARAEQDRAAEVIWLNLPFRVDRIVVSPRSGSSDFTPRRDYPRALLEQRFGPRPDDLDRSASDIARRAVLIAGIVALVLLVLVVVIIVLVVRALRRRPAPPPAGPWPQGGPQQPWGQPGWGQPPPPGQPGWGQPPGQPWPPPQAPAPGQAPAPPQPPPGQPPPPEAPPTQAPPAGGPGDTQRLEPGPPPDDQGPPRPPGEQGPVPPA